MSDTPDVVIRQAPALEASVEPLDLRTLFRAIGTGFVGERSLLTSPPERLPPEKPVDMLDEKRTKVKAKPLEVLGFVDGIQAALTVAWRDHRPVFLTFIAAGCVGAKASGRGIELVSVHERLDMVASHLDAEWLATMPVPVSTVLLDAVTPDDVERAALTRIGADRDLLERKLVTELSEGKAGVLVLDGSLAGRPVDNNLVGVVKTTRTKWLEDESALWGLPQGWRSARFRIPAGTQGCSVDRYSCYVRLFDASHRGWAWGLVRLEAYDPEMLEPLAALALAERQHPTSRDKRGDRHLASVRACEDVLRARRPAIFSLRG